MRLSARDLVRLSRAASRYVNGSGAVVQQVQEALARRNDDDVQRERQRRKLERKRVWASRWATLWGLVAAIFALVMILGLTGNISDSDGDGTWDSVLGGAALMLVSGTLAIRATRRMILLQRAQREFDGEQPTRGAKKKVSKAKKAERDDALPPSRSAAREPMQQLAKAEAALEQVLKQLAGTDAAPGPVPIESVEQARTTGVEAATALRATAAQLVAVETARDHSPEQDRDSLSASVRRLRKQLDEGLEGYRGLVSAAGRVVAASSPVGPHSELTNATDHLASLAYALREMSPERP